MFFILIHYLGKKATLSETSEKAIQPDNKPKLDFIGHINAGNKAMTNYQFETALEHFQEALTFRQDDPTLHFKIARLFVQKEDYARAAQGFKNVISLNPGQLEAYYELARVFYATGSLAEAHQQLDEALKINPGHGDSLRLKIKLFEKQEQPELALPLLEQLIEKHHRNKEYRQLYAELLQKAGEFQKALTQYQMMIEWDPSKTAIYRKGMGQIYYEQGDFKNAIHCFRQCFSTEDGPVDPAIASDRELKSQLAAALCNEGVLLFNTEQTDEAITLYNEALSHEQENPDIYYNLGKALAESGNTHDALQNFQNVINLNPQDAATFYEIGILHDNKGNTVEAIQYYQTSLELDPKHVKAYFSLGTLYGIEGKYNDAVTYLSEAIKLDPTYIDAIYNLAVAMEKVKQLKKAAQLYKKVLSLNENHTEARSNLAHLQRELKTN
ncbi:MAG: tetratricopeptide repeat protein [Vampirovibrio sp.]|nr:tetratricopeptide repeat protein [Vampirovibrio sp.]